METARLDSYFENAILSRLAGAIVFLD